MINMTQYREQVAEGLAVGIYSVFNGLEIEKIKSPYLPKGTPVNFDKYRNYEKNYFDMVIK